MTRDAKISESHEAYIKALEEKLTHEFRLDAMRISERKDWELEELENSRPRHRVETWAGILAGVGLISWVWWTLVPLALIPVMYLAYSLHIRWVNQGIDTKKHYARCRAAASYSRAKHHYTRQMLEAGINMDNERVAKALMPTGAVVGYHVYD